MLKWDINLVKTPVKSSNVSDCLLPVMVQCRSSIIKNVV